MDRPKVKSVGPKSKGWKELQSRRSFKSLNRVHDPNQHNESSFMQDPPSVRQNAQETTTEIHNNNMNADNKDVVLPTICTNNPVDKRALIQKNPEEIREVIVDSIGKMDADHSSLDEGYRKSSFDCDKDKIQESLDVDENKEKQIEHRFKTVRWFDEDKKSQIDLGISEDERNKRLEILMERRRSKKLSSFNVRRSGMGIGVGNSSCSQISALNIPKNNPFLEETSPVSAPSYMVKSNPFDLPYDPHEEKPILTGDSVDQKVKDTNPKEHSRSVNFAPPEFTNYKHKTSFETDFSIEQLPSGRLVTSTVENNEDDDRQPQQEDSNPNHDTDDKHAKEEENKEHEKGESSEKVVEKVVDIPEEEEVEHSDHESKSSSSSSSCEYEPMMRPNKEAILRCLSMSRMRMVSQGKSFHKHSETFDCGPSALFDKTKTDSFYFGGNKRIHYGSSNSVASDMQVEVSEAGTPSSSISLDHHQQGKGSLLNPFETDVYDVRLSDVDDFSDQGSVDSGFSRTDHDSDNLP